MLNKIRALVPILKGYVSKWQTDIRGFEKIPSLSPTFHEGEQVVVSLTSYGRRVSSNVVCYTIVSILRQTMQPDRIILWLEHENWSLGTIPNKLRRLQEKGVEIRFCDNMRSYKK